MPEPLSPLIAIAGGLLIGGRGAAAAAPGRIAGVSGMVAIGARIADAGPPWRLAAAFVVGAADRRCAGRACACAAPEIRSLARSRCSIAAGLLVGFGTRLGNGCTSGHGVCGMARPLPALDRRDATFMAAALRRPSSSSAT